MYRAKTGQGREVVVKFTHTYCPEAHTTLAEKNYAPQLLFCDDVTSRYKMVVMEYLDQAIQMDTFMQERPERSAHVLEQCESALCELHGAQYCHGDFREANILVHCCGREHDI